MSDTDSLVIPRRLQNSDSSHVASSLAALLELQERQHSTMLSRVTIFRVVDDVFPARKAPFASPRAEGATAVDTMSVPLDNFLFEPVGDIPSVH